MVQSKLEAVDLPDKEDDQFGGDIVIGDGPVTTNVVNVASRPPIGSSNILDIVAPIQPENFEPRKNHILEDNSNSAQEDRTQAEESHTPLPQDETQYVDESNPTPAEDNSTQARKLDEPKKESSPNPAVLAAAQKATELFKLAEQAEAEQELDMIGKVTASLVEKAGGETVVKEVAEHEEA